MADDGTRPVKALLRALVGEAVSPPPVWLMRQAGRYLPEYRAVRAKVPDFVALCTTPDLATEVTLQPLRRFALDAAILFSDILILPWALGQDLRFVSGDGPRLDPVREGAALARLRPEAIASRLTPVFETVARLRTAVGEATLIGFAGSPFTVACYMVDGSGGDFPLARHAAYADPVFFGDLVGLLSDATIAYLDAQIEAGAETVMLFDSWAGLLPPLLFRRHVIAPTRRIVAALRARHPLVPVIGFPRLAGALLAEYAATTGVQAVGMDTSVDPAWAAGAVAPETALQGNLDPLALVAGGTALAEATHAILAAMRGRAHVFNLGHGITPDTPPEHVTSLIRQIQAGVP